MVKEEHDPEMVQIDSAHLAGVCTRMQNRFGSDVINTVSRELGLTFTGENKPKAFRDHLHKIEAAQNYLSQHHRDQKSINIGVEIVAEFHGFFKTEIAHERLQEARRIEPLEKGTSDRGLLKAQKSHLEFLNTLLLQKWAEADRYIVPHVSDFLTIATIEKDSKRTLNPKPDDKFGILSCASVLLKNMRYHRDRCDLRNVPLVVAFVDIDKLGDINKNYTESIVDREFLPKFMSVLESCVFYHGEGYRIGGDEYVILLPNSTEDDAIRLLQNLQDEVESFDYGIEVKPTITIGMCSVTRDCILTEQEIMQRANKAENEAKGKRNCIAIADVSTLKETEPRIVFRKP